MYPMGYVTHTRDSSCQLGCTVDWYFKGSYLFASISPPEAPQELSPIHIQLLQRILCRQCNGITGWPYPNAPGLFGDKQSFCAICQCSLFESTIEWFQGHLKIFSLPNGVVWNYFRIGSIPFKISKYLRECNSFQTSPLSKDGVPNQQVAGISREHYTKHEDFPANQTVPEPPGAHVSNED